MLKASKYSFKPYDLLLFTAILLWIGSWLPSDRTLDIHLHDTYYVIAEKHLLWALSVVLLVLWVLYKLLAQVLYSKVLTWLHVLLTVPAFLLIAASVFFQPEARAGYSDWSSFDSFQRYNNIISLIIMVCILCQPVVILNVTLGVIGWLRKKRDS